MAFIRKENKYDWDFEIIGGCSRVKITKGEDIAHLHELDPKMWTVLSCPVKGLEIDEKSLVYMDADGDGKIRVQDVISTAKWVVDAVNNPDLLLKGEDGFDVDNFSKESELGKNLSVCAGRILESLGKQGGRISISDVSDISAIFAKTTFNGDGVIIDASADDPDQKAVIASAVAVSGGVMDRSGVMGVNGEIIENFYKSLSDYAAWQTAKVEAPYGDKTDKAVELYNALDAKVKDYFMRSKLAAFSPDSTSTLDVQNSRIEAISADNLTGKTDEIATYPLARITGEDTLDLRAAINPVWAAQFAALKEIVMDPKKKELTEAEWCEIGAKFAAYEAWKGSKVGAEVESLGLETIQKYLEQNHKDALLAIVAKDAALKGDVDNIAVMDKFLHVYRDFYRLLKNFITFHDFYDKCKETKAIFQSGRLIIDQRECLFCMKVDDMGKHSAAAPSSGMYLVYCDCTAKGVAGKLQIMAAITVGDIGDVVVGKNAIYYDNKGVEYDAVITKVIDNPISMSQAFWSPYRRIASTVEGFIAKNAADKDAKIMKDVTTSINNAPKAAADPKAAAATAAPFDIGKFAGIFAALGMAVGMIGSALASLVKGLVALSWWQVILTFVGCLLVISGPAMVMAWMKLRRRNIAPLLNANGWAMNASTRISIPFGETLTNIAKFPTLNLKDPYAKKGIPAWKKWVISLSSLVVVLVVLWICNLFAWAKLPSPLPCFNKEEVVVVEETVEEVVAEESPVVVE
ncbi:MAG: hypothetical protein J6R25_00950 [Bacteroidales bacterium]|nr:hypothetical protein [Bacteroidales bacterium]